MNETILNVSFVSGSLVNQYRWPTALCRRYLSALYYRAKTLACTRIGRRPS